MSAQGSTLRIAQNQRLALTETLIKALELLQMSAADLEEAVQTELDANPLIEREDSGPEAAADERDEEAPAPESSPFDEPAGVAPIEREPCALDWSSTARRLDESDPDAYETLAQSDSLGAFLEQELSLQAGLNERIRVLILWLIGNLNDDGLFEDPFEAITDACPEQASPSEWCQALSLLQQFAPAGIGARSKTEMLTLQLGRLQPQSETVLLAKRLLSECSDLLSRRDFRAMSRTLCCPASLCERAFQLIGTLDPHPAARFSCPEQEGFVIPEILVHKTASGAFRAILNPACTPRLRFNEEYFELLSSSRLPAEDFALWRSKAQDARGFVHALEQRAATLLAVAREILRQQPDFFRRGDGALHPMTLKDIAGSLGISVSTVSRVTSGKYMQTPRGTFELKHFFSSALPSSSEGESVSSKAARERIRSLVRAEDPSHPLSDAAIAETLAAEGIRLARRTVAKYREMEGIAPKSERKRSS